MALPRGVCQRGLSLFGAAAWIGGLLCGRRGALEGCAKALPRGSRQGVQQRVREPLPSGVARRNMVFGHRQRSMFWESLEDLECVAARESGATMLGHIAAETAKKWLGWELGELYVMGYRRKVVFCIYSGTLVI